MGALYRIVHEEPPRLENAGWLAGMLENTMTREPADRWPMTHVRDFLAGGPLAAETATRPSRTATAVVDAAPAAYAADDGGTQVLAPTPVPPAPAPVPVHRRGPGGAIIGVLLALAVVALFLLFAWLFGAFDAQSSSDAASDPSSDPSSSKSTETSPSDPTSSASDPAEQAAAMEDFATAYVQSAVDDPKTSWEQLTPAYQAESGGFGQYKKFWDQWESADVSAVSADAEAGTVSYSISYRGKKGAGFDDNVTLDLEQSGDGFLIAGAQ